MNTDLDDALQRYFHDTVHDRLGETPVGVVVRRGRRRRARRRTAVMGGTLAVGTLGSVLAVTTLSSGSVPRSIEVGTPDNPTGGADGDAPATTSDAGGQAGPTVALGPSPLVWNEVTVGSAEAVAIGEYALPQGLTGGLIVDPAGGFYALSTAPGRGTTAEAALYHSADGVTWEQRGAPTTAISPHSNLAAGAGRLYTVGTQAASAKVADELDPGQLVLAQSADGGATWQDEPLPVDLGAIRTLEGVRSVRTQASVAATDDTSVIAAVTAADIDQELFVPPGVDPRALDAYSVPGVVVQYELEPCDLPPDASSAPTSSPTGPPDGCYQWGGELARYTWEELGIPAATIDAVLGHVHLLVSTDGGAFERVAAPALPDPARISDVDVSYTGDRFVALVRWLSPDDAAWTSQTTAFVSTDGRAWSELDAPVASVSNAGALADGSLVVIGIGADAAPVLAVLRDGAWETRPLPSLADAGGDVSLDWMRRIAIGPLGIAVYGQVADAAPQYQDEADAMFNGAGAPTTTVVMTAEEASGTGTLPSPEADAAAATATSAPDVTATAPPSTTPVAGHVTDSTALGGAAQYGPASTLPYGTGSDGTAYDQGTVRSVLLFSRDGVTWSADELPIDDPVLGSYAGVVVTDEHLAISTLATPVPYGDPEAPPPDQRVFVATLAG